MDLEAVKEIISSQGWTPQERKKQRGTLYLYAAKWDVEEQKTMWRYICAISQAEYLTEEQILATLSRPPRTKRKPA